MISSPDPSDAGPGDIGVDLGTCAPLIKSSRKCWPAKDYAYNNFNLFKPITFNYLGFHCYKWICSLQLQQIVQVFPKLEEWCLFLLIHH